MRGRSRPTRPPIGLSTVPRSLLAALAAFLPGPIKRIYMRLVLRAKIEKGVKIGVGTVILARDIQIGSHVSIGRFCRIKATAFRVDSYSQIGDRVRISVHDCHLHSRTRIDTRTTVAGDSVDPRSVLSMGMHCWIFQDCFINVSRSVVMGRNVGVGGGTYLFTHGFWLSQLEGYPNDLRPVTIGDDVWLPWGCFILPGVDIGSGSVVGARSLVGRDVPPGALVAGSPARVIRDRANRSVGWDEKTSMLVSFTESLAERWQVPFNESEGATFRDLLVDGSPILRIHSNIGVDESQLSEEALNIVAAEPRGDLMGLQWLALDTSLCSEFPTLNQQSRLWLEHAREIGLRFYPKDEVAQYV